MKIVSRAVAQMGERTRNVETQSKVRSVARNHIALQINKKKIWKYTLK